MAWAMSTTVARDDAAPARDFNAAASRSPGTSDGSAEARLTASGPSGGRIDWAAGRGYDRREYEPLGIDFDHNQSIFEEGMEVVRRLWQADGPISHVGRHYRGVVVERER